MLVGDQGQAGKQCSLWAEASRGSGGPHLQITKQEGRKILGERDLDRRFI